MSASGLGDQAPDADLWRSVRQGSVPAFEAVVRRYQSVVAAVAYNACGDLALSEDVAQEAFWAAWRQRASLEEPAQLGAWLCGIARNLGHNARRRAARSAQAVPLEGAADVPGGAVDPAEAAVSREEEALVWQTLEQIPETYREPLILYYRAEQSVAEVAAALDLSPDAVKQRLARGRGMLQERVAQLVEGALRRSRPGRPFTVAVITGLATLSVGSKTALAGAGGAGAAGPLVKAAGTGLAGGVFGSVLGTLGGLAGTWFGAWLPAQMAPTKSEREYLLRVGKRSVLVFVLLTLVLMVLVSFAGQLPVGTYLLLLGAWFVLLWGYLGVEMVCAARALKRMRAAAGAEPNDAPLRRWATRYRGRVYRSRATLLGLPLLDVNVSDPARAGELAGRRVARGWIAIGDVAYGVVFAFGGRACGLIAVGGLTVGLLAVGGLALGGFALGGLAAGGLAVGGIGLGWQAAGGLALAWDLACGGAAVARHTAYGGLAVARDYAVGGAAWAAHANDAAANAAVSAQPLCMAFAGYVAWYVANAIWFTPVLVLAILLLCAAPLLILYRRDLGQ